MDLQNVNLLKLQTKHMQSDPTTIAMCAALNPKFKEIAGQVQKCLIFAKIDQLPENILDELAWELHIDWYDATAPIEVKRALIKNSDIVHMHHGTPYAVEQVVIDYFGDGYIEEWFEYGGLPYGFRVVTSNPSATNKLANLFSKAVMSVKNKRSYLEQIIITMTSSMDIYFGAVLNTFDNIEITQVGFIDDSIYLTWDELEAKDLTYDELDALNISWYQFEILT